MKIKLSKSQWEKIGREANWEGDTEKPISEYSKLIALNAASKAMEEVIKNLIKANKRQLVDDAELWDFRKMREMKIL